MESRGSWMVGSLFLLALFFLGMMLSGCSSVSKMSNLNEEDNVKVSRHDADDDCRELGKVQGRTISTKGNAEEALKDLRQEAANKGANYVQVQQYSATSTAVTGVAYLCP